MKKNVNKQPLDIVHWLVLQGKIVDLCTEYVCSQETVSVVLSKINLQTIGTLKMSF